MREVLLVWGRGGGGGGGAVCEDILVVNVFKFVFNTQFVVSKQDHIQQKLRDKI